MGNEPALLPQMQLVAGRLEHEAQRRVGEKIEADLMRRARCGAGNRAGEAPVDWAMEMAAQDPLDLRMAGDDRGERGGIFQPVLIHVGDAGDE